MCGCDALALLTELRQALGDLGDTPDAEKPVEIVVTPGAHLDAPIPDVLYQIGPAPGQVPLATPIQPSAGVIAARPMRARGVTSASLRWIGVVTQGDLILQANPLRRAFAFLDELTAILLTPDPAQAARGMGMVVSGTNLPQVYYEEIWGTLIQYAWYTAQTTGPGNTVWIYEECYLS